MSIGYDIGKLPIKYTYLKIVELNQVSFEDLKEIQVVLRLIVSSPNLKELVISVSFGELVTNLLLYTSAFIRHTMLGFHIFVLMCLFFAHMVCIGLIKYISGHRCM